MISKPLLLELLFLRDFTTSRTMWATSRLAPPTILVNWPVTRFATGGTPMAKYLIIIIQQTRFCSYCDGGATNSSLYYIFKQDLQALVNELAMEIPIPDDSALHLQLQSDCASFLTSYFSPVSGANF